MTGRPRSRWADALILAVGFVAVAAFYVWTTSPSLAALRFGKPQFDYYSLLLHGFLKGHLFMDTPVSEELSRLANPYDPAGRAPGSWLADASYYQGHYYLYFGVTPLVTLLLPFRLITGVDLPVPLALAAFAAVGFLASLTLWKLIRDRYFPEISAGVTAAAVLLLGVVDLVPALLRRPEFYELPIAAAYCFLMIALLALYLGLHAPRRRWLWLAVAGLSLGLTVGARPIFVVAVPIILIPIIWRWRSGARPLLPDILAAAVPLAATGALLAAYNALRFGHWTEFGHHYQLNDLYYDATMRQFGWGYAPFNGFAYLFALPGFSRYYPFFLFPGGPSPVPIPPGYGEAGLVAGLLVCLPICWLAALSPWAGKRTAPGERAPLDAWLACAWGAFASVFLLLLFYFAAIVRYMADFTPALMVCASVGLLVLERRLRRAGGLTRMLGRVLWIGALAVSSCVALLLSVELYGLLQQRNDRAHLRVAEAFDRLSFWNAHVPGAGTGPVEIALRMNRIEPGSGAVVLARGVGADAETVALRGGERGTVEVVYTRGEEQPLIGVPLPAHPGETHRLSVDLGSRVAILFDGEPVIERDYEGSIPIPTHLFVGFDPNADHPRLSSVATVVSAARHGPVDLAPSLNSSAVALQFRLPGDRTAGSAPLLWLVDPSGGIGVVIDYVGPDQSDLRLVANGRDLARSKPLILDARSWHQLLLAQQPNRSGRPLDLSVDGETVLAAPGGDFDLFHSGPRPGWQPGSSARFTGFIQNVSPGTLLPSQAAPPGNRLTLFVRFPSGHKGAVEPLLVTGASHRGDVYGVVYLDEDHVRFEFDHWGVYLGYLLSGPIPIDYGATHRVDFWLPGLAAGTGPAGREEHGYTRVDLDGRSVWSQDFPYYQFSPDEIYPGRNAIGATTASEAFTGQLISQETAP